MRLRESELLLIYLIFDLTVLNISLFLTVILFPQIDLSDHVQYSFYFLHANLAWVITYFVFSKKNLYLRDDFRNRVQRITHRTSIFLIVSVVLGFIVFPSLYLTKYLIVYTLFFYGGKIIFYWFLYQYLKFNRSKGYDVQRTAIIGLNDTSKLIYNIIQSNPMLGYKFIGYISKQADEDYEVLGSPDELARLITEYDLQMIYLTLPLFSEKFNAKDYLSVCNRMGIRIRFVPEDQKWFKISNKRDILGDLTVINPQEIPLDDIEKRLIKRLFDVAFSGMIILLVFSWLFPILAIIIKLTSKGPVLFVQKRTGINNITFDCFKFRSMKVNRDANTIQATAGDSRITPIGRFMRRTNIDELPQFFNVLFGHMSVVGPRPHMLKHTEEYSQQIDNYMTRHYVKPGITGLAQVSGFRGETDELWKMEKRVQYDMKYIDNWTLWLDIKIIYLTLFDKKAFKNAA